MAQNSALSDDGLTIVLLPALTIAAAVSATTTSPTQHLAGMKHLSVEATFLYGAGGTTVDAYIQTTLDGGVTWFDIMNFHFTTAAGTKVSACCAYIAPASQAFTPGDAALAANTIIQGVLGTQIRAKYVTTGTYSGATSLALTAVAKG